MHNSQVVKTQPVRLVHGGAGGGGLGRPCPLVLCRGVGMVTLELLNKANVASHPPHTHLMYSKDVWMH